MTELGHVALYVRDLQRSLDFYRDAVGLQVVGELLGGRGAALSGGRTHHELLLIQAGEAQGPLRGRRVGLYHVAWKVGDKLDELRAVKKRLDSRGVPVAAAVDHHVSQSLYLHDPDGNEVELYVDRPDYDWRTRRDWLQTPPAPLTM
jgi:catechol 2,3-dioxygenase